MALNNTPAGDPPPLQFNCVNSLSFEHFLPTLFVSLLSFFDVSTLPLISFHTLLLHFLSLHLREHRYQDSDRTRV